MRLLGYDIAITKATPMPSQPLTGDRGNWWWPIIREPFTGAWQKNIELRPENIMTHPAVYACITLISTDIGKMRIRLVQQSENGIWSETSVAAFSPVLRKPNRFQNRVKFFEQWVVSKLMHGNTFVLKQRDERNIVTALYILDPTLTKVLVAPDGDIFYELRKDALSRLEDNVTIPASEIIHDTMVPLYHPLCGVSPISAAGLAAVQGLNIQKNSTQFFNNGSNPGGILTAPGAISDETAKRLKTHWDENYTGVNVGKVAVLGDGLKYEAMAVNAVDAQLIEQLKWTAETICSVFHVPPHMIGVAPPPAYNNIEALNTQYYSQCLQTLIESIELSLDEGLGLDRVPGKTYGTEFDLDDLLRMDTSTKVDSVAAAIKAGFLAPNEGRAKFDLQPVEGGNSPYLQQQNFSLEALSKRDQSDDPFTSARATSPAPPDAAEDDNGNELAVTAEQIISKARDHGLKFVA